MPELPEVETVKESLKKVILNKKISNIEIYYDRIIQNVSVNEFMDELTGEEFVDIKRSGKYLIFVLKNHIMLSHLRMEGKYNYIDNEDRNEHEHVIFYLDDGKTLRYNDTRKFGTMHLFNINDVSEVLKLEPLNKLGIEPLNENLTVEYLYPLITKKKKPLKTVLLDQSIISGLGNIYADEVCFMARLNPNVMANTLTTDDVKRIIDSSNEVIKKAIALGGTTIKSFTSSHMITGRFQNELLVHTKKKCPQCGREIKKIFIGGRGTYYCEECQK